MSASLGYFGGGPYATGGFISGVPASSIVSFSIDIAHDVEVDETPDEVLAGEPLIGWRVWKLIERGQVAERSGWRGMLTLLDEAQRAGTTALEYGETPVLAPLARSARGPEWLPRKRMTAMCAERRNHVAPGRACYCGVWAFKSLEPLRARFTADAYDTGQAFVCGTVALWGRVVVTTEGYRAQHAYPQELELITRDMEKGKVTARQIAGAYGIPCVAAAPWEGDHLENTEAVLGRHAAQQFAANLAAQRYKALATAPIHAVPAPPAPPPPPKSSIEVPTPGGFMGLINRMLSDD